MIKNGIDIVEIGRIKKILDKHNDFIKRNFSEREAEYISEKNFRAETIAGMFAAKEAFSKYLGTGFRGFNLSDIEVLHNELSKPYIVFRGVNITADVSISHSDSNAVAMVSGEVFNNLMPDNHYLKMQKLMPVRKSSVNKGDCGRVFVLGGSDGMTGAVCLSAMGALKSGSGLVTVGSPESQREIVAIKLTEAMTVGYADADGKFSATDVKNIIDRINSSDVCCLGMGMGKGEGVFLTVSEVVKNSEKPLVIDADGINSISGNIDILKELKAGAVLTPHPGEMSRLTGKSVEEIQNNRIKTAVEFSTKYNVVTVLKGENTVIADADGKYVINTTGNEGMATGGSGDVLAGIIASFIGQGVSCFDAAVLSVYLHGRAGDIAAEKLGVFGMIASDLVDNLPLAIKELLG